VLSQQQNTVVANEVEVQANDDFARLDEDQTTNIAVLENDFGLYDGVQSLTIKTEPQYGHVSLKEDNTFDYIPDISFFGNDVFTYTVCNVHGNCDWATVYITVDNVDFKPVAVNDSVVFTHGSSQIIRILDNDTIKGDYPYEVSIVQNFNHGDAYLDEDNILIPTFNRNFGEFDSLKYSICDLDNDCSEAWVHVDVRHDGAMEFYIPNGFSPNGDGLNDEFFIPDFRTYDHIQIKIFSEWGQLVYQDENYQNNWDGVGNAGTQKGKRLENGTYYYVFNIEGVSSTITGYIYLSR